MGRPWPKSRWWLMSRSVGGQPQVCGHTPGFPRFSLLLDLLADGLTDVPQVPSWAPLLLQLLTQQGHCRAVPQEESQKPTQSEPKRSECAEVALQALGLGVTSGRHTPGAHSSLEPWSPPCPSHPLAERMAVCAVPEGPGVARGYDGS